MRVIAIVGGIAMEPEEIDTETTTTTVERLRNVISDKARERSGCRMASVRLFTMIDEQLFPLPTEAFALNLEHAIEGDIVYAVITLDGEEVTPMPELLSCEPCFGPQGGGNTIKIHARGFSISQRFLALQIEFGSQMVPATRVSETLLLCVAPPHAAGPVTVRLLCGVAGRDHVTHRESETLYEYVREELMYDAIFASTNSHCPVQHVLPRGAREANTTCTNDDQVPEEEQEDASQTVIPRWAD